MKIQRNLSVQSNTEVVIHDAFFRVALPRNEGEVQRSSKNSKASHWNREPNYKKLNRREKIFFVLLQITNYIFSPRKCKEECNMLSIVVQDFCPLKINITQFPDEFRLNMLKNLHIQHVVHHGRGSHT